MVDEACARDRKNSSNILKRFRIAIVQTETHSNHSLFSRIQSAN
jgi:hypothetical protein